MKIHSHTWGVPLPYENVMVMMKEKVSLIKKGIHPETLWFLEHPSVYTKGACDYSSFPRSLACPCLTTDRGGGITYHGPGQRIVYLMVNLHKRKLSVHEYIYCLEEWIIKTLSLCGLTALRYPPHTGVWVEKDPPQKIAFLGIRVSSGITSHGISLNIAPDLSFFSSIRSCGLSDPVTSLHQCRGESSTSIAELYAQTDRILSQQCPFFIEQDALE